MENDLNIFRADLLKKKQAEAQVEEDAQQEEASQGEGS